MSKLAPNNHSFASDLRPSCHAEALAIRNEGGGKLALRNGLGNGVIEQDELFRQGRVSPWRYVGNQCFEKSPHAPADLVSAGAEGPDFTERESTRSSQVGVGQMNRTIWKSSVTTPTERCFTAAYRRRSSIWTAPRWSGR